MPLMFEWVDDAEDEGMGMVCMTGVVAADAEEEAISEMM